MTELDYRKIVIDLEEYQGYCRCCIYFLKLIRLDPYQDCIDNVEKPNWKLDWDVIE